MRKVRKGQEGIIAKKVYKENGLLPVEEKAGVIYKKIS